MLARRHVIAPMLLAVTLGCRAETWGETELPSPQPQTDGPSMMPTAGKPTRLLALRYHLALQAFNRGAYDDAAALFAQVLLDVPQDPAGDALRHLLMQHISWAMLGIYDTRGDGAALDAGEEMLERYLVRHEALLPEATAEREDIYALLGEYQLRRAEQPPPSAHDRLEALVRETKRGFEEQLVYRQRTVHDDDEIRIIEIETRSIPWAELDDPRVQAFFVFDGSKAGSWTFDTAAGLLNPTRVLVRGRVHHAGSSPTGRKLTRGILRTARPQLEECYERALVAGAEIVEHVDLEVVAELGAPTTIALTDAHGLHADATDCVRAALQSAAKLAGLPPEAYRARLSVTMFVQFEQQGPSRADYGDDYIFDASPLDADRGKQVQ